MLDMNVKVDFEGVANLINGIPKVNTAVRNVSLDFVKIARNHVAIQLVAQTKQASRQSMASRISYRMDNENRYVVTIPGSAHDLDTRQPTKKIVWGNATLRDWVMRYYIPIFQKTRQSRIYRNEDGSIRRGSFIMATSDPFVRTGFMSAYPSLREMLASNVEQVLGDITQ